MLVELNKKEMKYLCELLRSYVWQCEANIGAGNLVNESQRDIEVSNKLIRKLDPRITRKRP